MELDPLDKRIILALEEDGRRPYREMARELGVAEATIRARVGRLTRSGAFRITTVADPEKLGVQVIAVTLIRARAGRSRDVAEALAAYPNVAFVGSSFGSADVIVQSVHDSVAALHAFLADVLPHEIEGIESTDTYQVGHVHKSAWDWRAWVERAAEETGG